MRPELVGYFMHSFAMEAIQITKETKQAPGYMEKGMKFPFGNAAAIDVQQPLRVQDNDFLQLACKKHSSVLQEEENGVNHLQTRDSRKWARGDL